VSGLLARARWRSPSAIAVQSRDELLKTPAEGGVRAISETLFTWIAPGAADSADVRLDPLAAVMILVITGIGTLIHLYSTAYMHEETDSEYARYFSYLNLFAAFMLVLVLGASFR
jgi:NADH-quinone oxidoreductase subunit L